MDVFLSYNRADAPVARELDAWLRGQGVSSFLDTRELVSGQTWLPELERAITREAGAVAVLVGPSGLGNTQHYEHQLALVRQAREPGFPVIPVLLPGTPEWRFPRGFLELQTWVSFAGVAAPAAAPDALLRLLAAIRREKLDAAAVRAAICPYKGLEAFQEEDARIFFGRAEEAAQLHRTVVEGGVAAVIGRSGSGKSSLARAGLLPLLRRKGEAGWGRVWDRLVLRPGRYPLLALAEALEPGEPGQSRSERHAMHLRVQEELRRQSPDFVASLLHRQLEARERPVDRLLILLDQAEEMFARPIELTDPAEIARWQADAEALVALLVGAAARGPASLVLTIRSDYFDPLQHSAMGPLLSRAMVATRGVQDLRAAVEGPAALVGLRFAPGLVERVLRETGEDEGNLPLLQHALERSWKAREGEVISFAAYASSGGVEGAINQAAQGVYEALDAPGKAAAKRLFLRLVRPGEGRGHVRVRAPLPADAAERRVAEAFGAWNTRLLFFGEAGGVPTVEVAHEALIRGWGTLLEWVKENRERLAVRDAVLDWMRNSPGESLQQGALLTRARELVGDPGDMGVEEIAPLVARSAEAVQTRRVVRLSFLATAAFVVVIAVSHVWTRERALSFERERSASADAVIRYQQASAEAERALSSAANAARAAARDTSASLIFDVVRRLRDQAGISAELVRDLLGLAERSLDTLLTLAADDTSTLFLRGSAHIEFAHTYRVLGNTVKATEAADAARRVFEHLTTGEPGNNEWQAGLGRSHETLGDVLTQQGELDKALDAYRAAAIVRRDLVRRSAQNVDWQRDLQWIQMRLGALHMARGDLRAALGAYREASQIAGSLASADPSSSMFQRDSFTSHLLIGDVYRASDDLPNALRSYLLAREFVDALAAREPNDLRWQRNLSLILTRTGIVLQMQNELDGALAAFRSSLEVGTRLAALDSANTEWQRDVSVSFLWIGDVLRERSDWSGALAAYRAGMEIRQRLAAGDPGNAAWQRDLLLSHERIGDVQRAGDDLPGALAAYRAGIEIAARLAAADPGNVEWQRNLSISHSRIGDVLVAEGDLIGALAAYRAAMEIRQGLVAADPNNAEWLHALSLSHERIGTILGTGGNLRDALASHLAAMEIRRRLAAIDPSNADWQRDLFVSHWRLGTTLLALGQTAAASQHAESALVIARQRRDRHPDQLQTANDLQAADALIRRINLPLAP